jgi:hypothetical protein
MQLNIGKEVAALKRMTIRELRGKYTEVFKEPTNANNKAWLVKRIAWRLQALAEGDLSERARQRAAELARDADLRLSPPKLNGSTAEAGQTAKVRFKTDHRLPLPGTILTRPYKGEDLHVKVLSGGFEFEGELYQSLSAVAKKITGSHCNGYLFFGLAAWLAQRDSGDEGEPFVLHAVSRFSDHTLDRAQDHTLAQAFLGGFCNGDDQIRHGTGSRPGSGFHGPGSAGTNTSARLRTARAESPALCRPALAAIRAGNVLHEDLHASSSHIRHPAPGRVHACRGSNRRRPSCC